MALTKSQFTRITGLSHQVPHSKKPFSQALGGYFNLQLSALYLLPDSHTGVDRLVGLFMYTLAHHLVN